MAASEHPAFERMRLYANTLERASPPVFVGRERELRTLSGAVGLVASENPRGMTHYRKRLGSLLRHHANALGGLAQAATETPLTPPEVAAAFEIGDDFGQAVQAGHGAELAALAVQRGVLTLADDDGDLCYGPPPIPSMTQHLATRYRRKLAEADPAATALANLFADRKPRQRD